MPEIEVSHLTKDYGSGRGVFDVSLEVERGECFGFLGPNGAGKTTTIRHLMGFSRPQAGTVAIHGQDCWTRSAELQRTVGYLPGEIALPAGMTGTAFLRMMERMRGVRDDEHLKMLLDTFRLDPDIPTREMSLGVKRKMAVVTAFMHDPDILILDQPTSGLDLGSMRTVAALVRRLADEGRAVLVVTHDLEFIGQACDKAVRVEAGRIAAEAVVEGDLQAVRELLAKG